MLRLDREAASRMLRLIGGSRSESLPHYIRNVAANNHSFLRSGPRRTLRCAREMRERGEELLAIYHSHPRAADPEPSETDVRLAYYPSATYLIVGLGGAEAGHARVSHLRSRTSLGAG